MTQEDVQYVIDYWMRRADEALASTRLEEATGHYHFAINWAYYACFYAASAVLLQEGCKFVKHSGVCSAVHQDLVKTGRLDVRWGDVYDQLFDSRHRADYIALAEFDAEDAAELIREAEGFVLEMRRLLIRIKAKGVVYNGKVFSNHKHDGYTPHKRAVDPASLLSRDLGTYGRLGSRRAKAPADSGSLGPLAQ